MNNIEEIKTKVREKLKQDIVQLIEEYESNLAIVLTSEISEYSPEWCAETPTDGNADEYNQEISEYIDAIVDNELAILFTHAKEEYEEEYGI